MTTNNSINEPTAAAGTVLQGQGVGTTSAFSTATYPATTTSQQILYSTATNVVGQLTTANSKFPATNSTGTLAMRELSVVQQFFITNGTYTPTAGMVYCEVKLVGGGGAGGGCAATGAGQTSVGGGGGGGEYAEGVFSAATIGVSQAVTCGAGGTGVSGAAGNNGSTTSLGALLTAGGGLGGAFGAAGASSSAGPGTGGTGGSGGTYHVKGWQGQQGQGSFTGVLVLGGAGGNSPFGSGGTGYWSGLGANGTNAFGYGAGGGGSSNYISSGSAFAGGAGTIGCILVTEYVIA